MTFWGLTLESGKRYAQKVETSFRLSMAALDVKSCDNTDLSVVVNVDKNDYVLCTLSKQRIPQQMLDLNFQAGENIAFMTKGKGIVHLTGYLVPEEDFSMMPSDEEEEYSEEDEEQVVVAQTKEEKKRKIEPQVNKVEAKKQKLAVVEQKEESDDELESEEDSDYEAVGGEEAGSSDGEGEEMDEEDESGDDEEDSDMWDDENEGEESDDESDEDEEEEEEKTVTVPTTPKSKKEKQQEQQKAKTPQMNGTVNQQQSGKKKNKEEKVDKGQTPKGQNQQTPKGQTPKGQNQAQTPKGQTPKEKPGQTPKTPKTPASTESPQKKTLQGGVQIEDTVVGNGPAAKSGKMVGVYYVGRLKNNNKLFDSSTSGPGFKFRLGTSEVIKGWDIGVQGMKVGGKRKIVCPPHMAYGAKGSPPAIPPNSWLTFEVELKSVS